MLKLYVQIKQCYYDDKILMLNVKFIKNVIWMKTYKLTTRVVAIYSNGSAPRCAVSSLQHYSL